MEKGRKGLSLLAAATMALTLAGCLADNLVWTRSYNFPSGRWSHDNRLTMKPDSTFLEDCEGKARGVVSLRYAGDAAEEAFRLVMETESPATGGYRCDTLQVRLLPAAERTANHARMGIFEQTDTINLPIQPAPGWSVTFYPASRGDLTGIYSMTFEILK